MLGKAAMVVLVTVVWAGLVKQGVDSLKQGDKVVEEEAELWLRASNKDATSKTCGRGLPAAASAN